MGAMVARGVEPVLKAFERLIAAGKPNKVASIAAARKLFRQRIEGLGCNPLP